MSRELAFVDHHAHLLRVAAGVVPGYGAGGTARPELIAAYHRRVAEAGSTPMDEPPERPAVEPSELPAALVAGLQTAADLGLVQITEAGMADWDHWDALVAARAKLGGALPCRVQVLVASGAADRVRMAAARAENDEALAMAGVKFYADGWLGPRTCACSRPFADRPGDPGVLFMDAETLAARAAPYAEDGWTIATHAIGDRAVEAVLDAYDRVFAGDVTATRAAAPRVEHAQLLRPDLITRFAESGVVACIQPCFRASDEASMEAGLAGAFPDAYRWDKLLAAGARVLIGSDHPIESLDPALGLARLIADGIDAATAEDLVTRVSP